MDACDIEHRGDTVFVFMYWLVAWANTVVFGKITVDKRLACYARDNV